MKIFAFATIFAASLAAPVDTSVEILATTTIAIESIETTEVTEPSAYFSDETDEDILDYSDEEFEAIFTEVEMMVKHDEQ